MKSVLARVPAFRLGRAVGRPFSLPATLTINVLYACNSRCKTCNIYETRADVLSLEEYDRIFAGIGRAPRWVTFTGGEPFLRPDLADVMIAFARRCRPAVMNVPTNGSFPDRIEESVDRVARAMKPHSLIVNLSIDEVGPAHDALRGLRGNWDLAMRTAANLKKLRAKHGNLVFGVNTVVSRFNEDRLPDIAARVDELDPDSYVTEVAGHRVELGNHSTNITPSKEGILAAMRFLRARSRRTSRFVEALVASLRAEYYGIIEQHTVSPREVLPCYAAITSAHIMPEGKVWACCVLGEELGRLREVDYDFRSIWYGATAARIRARIKSERCHCTLANQTYLNMLMDPQSLVRAGSRAALKLAEARVSP